MELGKCFRVIECKKNYSVGANSSLIIVPVHYDVPHRPRRNHHDSGSVHSDKRLRTQ